MASHSYLPLSNFDDQSVEIGSELNPLVPSTDLEAPRLSPSRKVISVTSSIFYLGLGAVVAIVINLILLYIHVSSSSSPLYSATSQVSLRDLRYPSQYIGLDRVTQSVNGSTYRRKPLHRINHPDVLVQIIARNSIRRYPHIVNQTSNFLVSNKVRSADRFLGISYSVAERSTALDHCPIPCSRLWSHTVFHWLCSTIAARSCKHDEDLQLHWGSSRTPCGRLASRF
jgi:hypothetical protein